MATLKLKQDTFKRFVPGSYTCAMERAVEFRVEPFRQSGAGRSAVDDVALAFGAAWQLFAKEERRAVLYILETGRLSIEIAARDRKLVAKVRALLKRLAVTQEHTLRVAKPTVGR